MKFAVKTLIIVKNANLDFSYLKDYVKLNVILASSQLLEVVISAIQFVESVVEMQIHVSPVQLHCLHSLK